MSGDTEALAKSAEAVEPVELEPQPYDELDKAVIRATQGDLPVVPEPYAEAARELGHAGRRAARAPRRAWSSAGCCAASPRSSSTAAPASRANGMGVWKVPEDRILEVGPRMAAFRGISHCYQRPTYADWPYQLFTMAHGRSKEECDAILDAIETEIGCIEERATLYSSTEFKKVRLLYFTDDFKDWEREHAGDA